MSSWRITYRGPSGSIKTETLEAADRAAAIAEARRHGIAPMAVETVSERRHVPNRESKSLTGKKIFVFAVLLISAGVGLLFMSRKSGGEDAEVLEINPAAAEKTHAERKAAPATTNEAVKASMPTHVARQRELTNSVEKVVATTTNATLKAAKPKRKSTFKTGTEQMLSQIFTCRLGDTPPPLPRINNLDKNKIWEILNSSNLANENDTDKEVDAKQVVAAAKKELKAFLLKGGDVQEFLAYYRSQLMQAHHEWQDSQISAIKACREEDPEVARAYIDEVNKRLSEKGIKNVKLPPLFKKKLGLE